MSVKNGKEEKMSEVSLDLSQYVNRGIVRDKIQMTGNIFFVNFSICVDRADDENRTESVLMGSNSQVELDFDSEKPESDEKQTNSSSYEYKNLRMAYSDQ
jgi:hypothetical protein